MLGTLWNLWVMDANWFFGIWSHEVMTIPSKEGSARISTVKVTDITEMVLHMNFGYSWAGGSCRDVWTTKQHSTSLKHRELFSDDTFSFDLRVCLKSILKGRTTIGCWDVSRRCTIKIRDLISIINHVCCKTASNTLLHPNAGIIETCVDRTGVGKTSGSYSWH